MKSALMVRELLACHFSLNTAATSLYNCNLTQIMTRTFNYAIIIGGSNVGDFVQQSPIAKVYCMPIFHLTQ